MVLFSLSSMAGEHAQAIRDQPMLVNFFFLGVLNNVTYVILLAGAPEIAANGIGWVYFSAVAPAILVKTSSVWWFDKVSYAHRMLACTTLMAVSFVMVAFGARMSTKLLGVVCCALQSALGEASCLALTSRFPSGKRRLLLTGWSSGTGIAGIAGYVWVAVFLHALEVSFAAMLVSALLVLPVALCYVYFCGVHGSFRDAHICVERGTDEVQIEVQIEGDDGGDVSKNDDALGSDHGDTATLRGRIATILPYASPLFFVYFAEYACQSGVWITIGFPPESELARKQFYSASNTLYQIGVFLSRSSGAVFELCLSQLLWLAWAQLGLLIFFIIISATKVLYGWWLLLPAFMTGVFGGLCYVNAFRLLSSESPPAVREKNLALTSTADSLGVACADLVGVVLQRWLTSGG